MTRTPTRSWYKGARLPHHETSSRPQFITYRLIDSIPSDILQELKAKAETPAELRRLGEQYLDGGRGNCYLREPEVAEIVVENLKFHAGTRYRLLDWVVMPNHVHLTYDRPKKLMKELVQGWKSYTAHKINDVVGRSGPLWQIDYFDRYMRDDEHLFNVRCYILLNPVQAGLVDDPFDWPYSSIHDYRPEYKDDLRRWYRSWRKKFWEVD